MKRREFLGTAAGMLAASTSVAAPAPGGEKIPCAVLGLGHAHGASIVKTLADSPDFDLVGICEPDEQRRVRFAEEARYQNVRWLSQDDVLGNPDIRMVAVESDVQRLLELGRKVVDAGKHLHLDKPAGTSLPEFRGLLDEADRQKVFVQMGYMYRYNPGFNFIRQMKSDGALGHVHSIHASMCTDLSPSKRQELLFHPGGIMLELGCHLIDMIVLLLGEPHKVTAFLRHDTDIDDGLNDNAVAVLEFENALATVEITAKEPNAFASRRFKIAGTDGAITLCPLEPPAAQLSLRNDHGDYKKGVSPVEFPDQARHVPDIADLAACIRGERAFGYPTTHDYAVQRTVLRACGEDV